LVSKTVGCYVGCYTDSVKDHIPNPTEIEDIINIACLISLIELGCFHHAEFYSKDGINEDTVVEILVARRFARHFVLWWDSCFTMWLENPSDPHSGRSETLEEMVENMVLAHAQTFFMEVHHAEGVGIEPFTTECTAAAVLEGLNRHFSFPIFSTPLKDEWQRMSSAGTPMEGYRYKGMDKGIVKKSLANILCPDLGESTMLESFFISQHHSTEDVPAKTVNDVCASCTWQPTKEDWELVAAQYDDPESDKSDDAKPEDAESEDAEPDDAEPDDAELDGAVPDDTEPDEEQFI